MKGVKRFHAESVWDVPTEHFEKEPDITAAREASLKEFRKQLFLWYCNSHEGNDDCLDLFSGPMFLHS
jgi:hypothetical protein